MAGDAPLSATSLSVAALAVLVAATATLSTGLPVAATAALAGSVTAAELALLGGMGGVAAAVLPVAALVAAGTYGPAGAEPATTAVIFLALAAGTVVGVRLPPSTETTPALRPTRLPAQDRRALMGFTLSVAAVVAAATYAVHGGDPSLLERALGPLWRPGGLVIDARPLALLVPILLTPVAVGWFAPPKAAAGLAVGGGAALLLGPLAVLLGLPAIGASGLVVPANQVGDTLLAATSAIAPIGAGVLAGAALARVRRPTPAAPDAVSVGIVVATIAATLALGVGAAPGVGVLVGAGVALLAHPQGDAYGGVRALGRAVATALIVALVVGPVLGRPDAALTAALAAGATVAGAEVGAAVANTVPNRPRRSVAVLALVLGSVVAIGLLPAALDLHGLVPAPHANALGIAAERASFALQLETASLGLILFGALLGVFSERLGRIGAPIGVGLLIGPVPALMVFLGSYVRTRFERSIMAKPAGSAHSGTRLLRSHAVAIGVIAGEGLGTLAVYAF